jgi:phosphatidylglycerophosphate synthase
MRDTAILGSPLADRVQTRVLAPRGLEDASRPVAGVTHLARALISAEQEGASRALVLLAEASGLKDRVGEELARAGASIEVEWSTPGLSAPPDALGLGDPRTLQRQVLLATGKPSDGLVSRWLNRPISRFVTARVLAIPGVRPWHLTLVTGAIAFAMFAALASGSRAGIVLGALLFHLASVVDGVDGEMARATFRSSRIGAVMDTSVDMATNLLFTLGITIGLTELHGRAYATVGGLAFFLYVSGVLLLAALVRQARNGPSFDLLKVVYGQRFPDGWRAQVVAAIRTATSRDFFAFVFAILAVLGVATWIPWLLMAAAAFWLTIITAAAPAVMARAGTGVLEPANQP